jgi:hypothetical protein
MNSKNLILFSALLITIWLAWRAPSEANDVALTARVQNATMQANKTDVAEQFALQTRVIAPSQLDLFGVIKPVEVFKPVIKAVSKPPPPIVPVAPPLPFKLIGRMQVGDGSQVLLNVKDEVTPVAVGDILLGQYKVLTIQNNANSTQIQMLYLPFNQIQTLNALTTN